MSNSVKFHEQLASLVEVLANTAVTEICKLVDDGYAVLRLEISQSQREIDNLRKKLLVTKLQNHRRTAERLGSLRQRRAVPRRTDSGDVAKSRDCPPPHHLGARFGAPGTSTQQGGGSRRDAGLDFTIQNGIPNTRDTQGRKVEEEEGDLPVIIKVESLTPTRVPVEPPGKAGSEAGNPGTCNPSLGSEDWEPDVVVVLDPGPIKVEAGLSSGWSLTDQDTMIRDACLEGGANGGDGGTGGEMEYAADDFNRLPFAFSSFSSFSSSSFSSPAASASLRTSGSLRPHQETGDRRHSLPDAPGGGSTSAVRGLPHLPSSSRPHPVHRSSFLPPGLPRGGGGQEERAPGAKPQFRCAVCGKLFPRPAALQRHQRVHTGEKPFSCRHCAKRFSYGHQLKNHERVHTGERPFPCTYCGKSFTQSSHMKRHLSVHTGHSMFRLTPR